MSRHDESAGGSAPDGLEPSLGASRGGSDANTFNEKRIRCVNPAIGMTDIHAVTESVAVADLRKTVEIRRPHGRRMIPRANTDAARPSTTP